MLRIFSYLCFFTFIFEQSFASPYFTELRLDQSIPQVCQEMEINFYSLPVEKFYVGREGAKNMGFTFEYPIKREHATILWQYFRDFAQGERNEDLLNKITSSESLNRDYLIIMRNFEEQGFEFASEGDILELLAIEFMYQYYPENMYYVTGGVAYHESFSSMTIGELDVYVGRRSDCSAIAVGEAKLGTGKMLHKAKDQLQRFENFLMDHNVPVVK